MLSLYIHIPFCKSKCPYCDFYSAVPGDQSRLDDYEKAVCERLFSYAKKLSDPVVGTVYFGGGTPSAFGEKRLCAVLKAAREAFRVAEDAEITAECNPADGTPAFFEALFAGGFNRVSMGMQSANAAELRVLGRRHTNEDVESAVRAARAAGFQNISLDLMLALPNSTCETLAKSVDFCTALGVEHVSSYLLKVEAGTPFARSAGTLALPDDDAAAEQYLFMVERLKAAGYAQYEISNFSRPGFHSRHNLQYWRLGGYLGIGPAAHSFAGGRRFYYPRDLEGFIKGNAPIDDGTGGDFEEYAMLALRLSEGLSRAASAARFETGEASFDALFQRAQKLPPHLVTLTEGGVALTPEGFLLSNAVLASVLP